MHFQDEVRPASTNNVHPPAPTSAGKSTRDGGGGFPQALLALQRTAGNAAVAQALRQGGHLGKREEHHGADCGHRAETRPQVQRSAVHDVPRGGGRPPDDTTRRGAGFSDIRAHTESTAEPPAQTPTPANAPGVGTVQRALTVNGKDYSFIYALQAYSLPVEQQSEILDSTVRTLFEEIDSKILTEFSPQEKTDFADERDRIEWQLRKWIVSPVGEQRIHPVLKKMVGKHPDFGAKNQDVNVNDVVELARGLMGWVYAKDKRRAEKGTARRVKKSLNVSVFLDSLLLRLNTFTENLKATLTPDRARAMEEELTTGLSHLLAQPETTDETGAAVHDPAEAGRPIGAYLSYFNPEHNEKIKAGSSLESQAHARGGMQAVLRNPEQFDFREKIMVLHGLTEYFGAARHEKPPTIGAGTMAELRLQDSWSTAGIDRRGERKVVDDRGRNPVRNPDDTTGDTTKEHQSTRNENSATTKFARAHRVPVWSGQSYTAGRMFKLAQAAGGTQREIAAAAWGIFAFWRLDFDHTTEFAYHTLHEVMDIAQNFGVPYDINDQNASMKLTSMPKMFDSLAGLGGRLDVARSGLRARIKSLNALQGSGDGTWTDDHARALSAAGEIVDPLDALWNRAADLAVRVSSKSTGRDRTILAQQIQTALFEVHEELSGLGRRFDRECKV